MVKSRGFTSAPSPTSIWTLCSEKVNPVFISGIEILYMKIFNSGPGGYLKLMP